MSRNNTTDKGQVMEERHEREVALPATVANVDYLCERLYDLYRDWLLAGKPMRAVRGVS